MSEMRFIVNERGKEQLVIENAKIRFHNYAGLKTDFNQPGNRNFDVILPDKDMAVAMGEKGWNVKIRKPRDPEDDPYYTLNVRINMNSRYKPTIEQIEGRHHIPYDEIMLGIPDPEKPEIRRRGPDDPDKTLDELNIDDIFIVINGSPWESQLFGSGIKAYLDQFYFREKAPVYGSYYDEEPEEEFDTEKIPF